MQKFLKNILIFSCIIIVLTIIGEIIVRNLPSSYSTKNREIRENGQNFNTLILGSSHTYYGINPKYLGDSVFNLANISQSPEYDYELLNYYKEYLPNLKYLIIPISYFTYADPKMGKGGDWKLTIKYKTRMNIPIHSDFSIYNFELTDYNGYLGQLSNIILKHPSNLCDSLGFGLGYNLDMRSPKWVLGGKERAKKHTLNSPGRFEEVLEVQKKIIKMAKENEWDITFITTPTYHSYYNNLDTVQEKEMKKGIEKLQSEYGVKYFNFLRNKNFTEEDFYDVDHLSDIGAIKFSLMLTDSLQR